MSICISVVKVKMQIARRRRHRTGEERWPLSPGWEGRAVGRQVWGTPALCSESVPGWDSDPEPRWFRSPAGSEAPPVPDPLSSLSAGRGEPRAAALALAAGRGRWRAAEAAHAP